MIADILLRLRCPTPNLDAFADRGNARFPRYWGRGGIEEDAWAQNWSESQAGLIWCNPPFEDLEAVVDKIQEDGAAAILVVPDWRNQPFFSECGRQCSAVTITRLERSSSNLMDTTCRL
jgi:hypothetical protein